MLNLVMTHSPRLAATATNKRLGEDVNTSPAMRHRLEWLRMTRKGASSVTAIHSPEPALTEAVATESLRERTA